MLGEEGGGIKKKTKLIVSGKQRVASIEQVVMSFGKVTNVRGSRLTLAQRHMHIPDAPALINFILQAASCMLRH